MYDQREKSQRDYEWAITCARQEGREEGRKIGRKIGREEGRKIARLTGKIQLMQELLGESPTPDAEFQNCDIETLTTRLAVLLQRFRDHQV